MAKGDDLALLPYYLAALKKTLAEITGEGPLAMKEAARVGRTLANKAFERIADRGKDAAKPKKDRRRKRKAPRHPDPFDSLTGARWADRAKARGQRQN